MVTSVLQQIADNNFDPISIALTLGVRILLTMSPRVKIII